MGNLLYNNISSEDLGLVIQAPPVYPVPARDVAVSHIPGRNGDILIDNHTYQNVQMQYSLAIGYRPGENLAMNAERIAAWLSSGDGYCRLEDSYDGTVYRLAKFKDGGSMQDIDWGATTFTATFDCKPQRFLKIGEKPIEFESTDFTIENPTEFTALPEIEISGLSTDSSSNTTTMLDVKDSSDTITSSVFLSNLGSDHVVIDSGEEKVYSGTSNLADKVGINQNGFPSFKKGKTTIQVTQYSEHDLLINKYNSIIEKHQTTLKAIYSPSSRVEDMKQSKYLVPSYASIIAKKQSIYDAESYSIYCQSKGDDYIIQNVNSLLKSVGQSITYKSSDLVGDSIPDGINSWLSGESNSDGTVKLSAKVAGFYIFNKDSVIKYHEAGEALGDSIDGNSSVTITYYPKKSDSRDIELQMPNQPAWLTYSFDISDSKEVKSVTFTVAKAGYFYLPKTGLFGKEGWEHKNEKDELFKLSWSGWKKAFTSWSTLSTDTTKSYEYIYLDSSEQLPTYEDITDEQTDASGMKVQVVTEECTFTVQPTGDNLENIDIKAKKDGFYRTDPTEQWKSLTAGSIIVSSLPSTDAFTVYYISSAPTYSDQLNFPTWLNPTVFCDGKDNPTPLERLNGTKLYLKVSLSGYYRSSYEKEEKDNSTSTQFTNWKPLQDGDNALNNSDSVDGFRLNNQSYYICRIDSIPTHYENDIAFNDSEYDKSSDWMKWVSEPTYYNDSELCQTIKNLTTPVNSSDRWKVMSSTKYDVVKVRQLFLDAAVEKGTLKKNQNGNEYYPNDDQNLKFTVTDFTAQLDKGWLTKDVVDSVVELLTKNPLDSGINTIMTELKVTVTQTVEFKAKRNGIFKWDTNLSWKNLNAGDVITKSKATDDTYIYCLEEMPSYEGEAGYDENYISEVHTSSSGNPTFIRIFTKSAGYYKVNTQSNWEYLPANHMLAEALPDYDTVLKVLTPLSDSSQQNIHIKITPHWWKL